jgi:hypothetical protein
MRSAVPGYWAQRVSARRCTAVVEAITGTGTYMPQLLAAQRAIEALSARD